MSHTILKRIVFEPLYDNKGPVIYNKGCRGGVDFSKPSEFFAPLQSFLKKFRTPTKVLQNISYPYMKFLV